MDLTAMRPMDLDRITELIAGATEPINVLWQTDDSIAFVARGREGRSEFHVDPSDEVMYMIRGDMNLHYRTPDGAEKVAVIREGEILHCPGRHPALAALPPGRLRAGARAQAAGRRAGPLPLVLPGVRRARCTRRCGRWATGATIRCPRSTRSSTAPRRTARAAGAGTWRRVSPRRWPGSCRASRPMPLSNQVVPLEGEPDLVYRPRGSSSAAGACAWTSWSPTRTVTSAIWFLRGSFRMLGDPSPDGAAPLLALTRRPPDGSPPPSRARGRPGQAAGVDEAERRRADVHVEEAGHEDVPGLVVDRLRMCRPARSAPIHHRHQVGQDQRLVVIVGHVDRGDAELPQQDLQADTVFLAQRLVEIGERLVDRKRAASRVMQRPSATRCFSPPDSVVGLRSSR